MATGPEAKNIYSQLTQDNAPLVGIAITGGVFASFADVTSQYSIAFSGIKVSPCLVNASEVAVGKHSALPREAFV